MHVIWGSQCKPVFTTGEKHLVITDWQTWYGFHWSECFQLHCPRLIYCIYAGFIAYRENLLTVDPLPDKSGYVAWRAAIFHCVICCLVANYRHIKGLCCLGVIAVWAPLSFPLSPSLTRPFSFNRLYHFSPHCHIFMSVTLLYITSITGSSLNNLWWSGFA